MLIETYSFGRMIIDGTEYNSDLIIFPDRVLDGWWRKSGHELCVEDIEEVLRAEPEVLVIGTGYVGLMKILPETKKALVSRGIVLIAEKTTQAYRTFNSLQKDKKAVGAFHLTC